MADEHSLIKVDDIAGFSEPANTLIKKVSDAIGGLYKPFQIRRVAQAEADADEIRAISEIKINELQRRAICRLVAEEAQKQQNIEEITLKALPELKADAKPKNIDSDWMANFFDKCRLVSDEQMQTLWARILAEEANSAGHFSKRTINLVAGIDKWEAQLFTQLCGFVVNLGGGPIPLLFDPHNPIYEHAGINFGTVNHLESIGLLHYGAGVTYTRLNLPRKCVCSYFGTEITIEFPLSAESNDERRDYVLNTGQVMLTAPGIQLAGICGGQPKNGFLEYVAEYYASRFNIKVAFSASKGQSSLPTQ